MKTSDELIALAKRAGMAVRRGIVAARRFRTIDQVTFPRMLAIVCGARKDGTLRAAERAFRVGIHEGR